MSKVSSSPPSISGPTYEELLNDPEMNKLGNWSIGNCSPPCDEQEYVERAHRYTSKLAEKLKSIVENIGN